MKTAISLLIALSAIVCPAHLPTLR